jgi:hypothetical protein
MMSLTTYNVVMLSAIMLNVIMLNVVAPFVPGVTIIHQFTMYPIEA